MTLRRTLTFAAIGIAVAGAAQAQTAADNRDADALAADMRLLAQNPLDIEALITAGEITLRMGDSTASAAFFGRAEKLDPLNPRIKAGWGSLMVRAERPGQALVKFQEAERRGLDPARFAADRGLAYDLIGEQERAQRDYRLALRTGTEDEVTRRYALSLGISGQKDEALRLLDPLLRRSDRAAWRDRAFILAMNGDTVGAEKIAATMMSPGLGAGLTPFFQKLSRLSAADRAFAVNFGELRVTPERVADARIIPPLPRLEPDPYAPKVVLAVATPSTARSADDGRKRKKRRRDDAAPAVTPAVGNPPVEVAMAPPSYSPAGPVAPAPAPTPVTTSSPRIPATSTPTSPRTTVAAPASISTPTSVAAAPPSTSAAVTPRLASSPSSTPAPVGPSSPVPTPTQSPSPPQVSVALATPTPLPVAATTPTPAVLPPITVAATAPPPEPGVADQPSPAEAGIVEPNATARVSEDTVLARIVANLDKPMPTDVAPSRRVPVVPTPKAAETRPKPDELKLAEPRGRGKAVKDDAIDSASATAKGRGKDKLADAGDIKGRNGKSAIKDDAPALDRNGCPVPVKTTGRKGKLAAVTETGKAERGRPKVPARCKAAAAKDQDVAPKADAARIWVQVAGGANEASLNKAWDALKAKAPDLFRGRQGWTTPLRATNRVLTGPFKSADEAQEFVNRLSRAGLSGFVFTSAKGQKVERLSGK